MCIVCERYQIEREFISVHRALEDTFDVTRLFVDDRWPASVFDIPDYQSYDAICWFVRYRNLIRQPAFDWRDYDGWRLMYDFDAYQNFSSMASGVSDSDYHGTWPKVFESNGFHALFCTGKATRDNLRSEGVNAIWVPKAYDETRLFPKHQPRRGIGYFGEQYNARAAMLASVKAAGIQVTRFRCPYADLNEHLNQFQICLISNMVGTARIPLHRRLLGLFPHLAYSISPGPEPMAKNFEIPGSGTVAACDHIPELEDLGFLDGETAIIYRDFDELVEKLRHYARESDQLAVISANGAKLCRERHTWAHRARQMLEVVKSARP